jgi:hypothetical protein
MTKEIALLANDQSVELDYFVQSYVDHVTRGMLAGLEGTAEFDSINSARVSIQKEEIDITVNTREIQTNPFVSKLIRNTLAGMVSSLKGVNTVDTLSISIERE